MKESLAFPIPPDFKASDPLHKRRGEESYHSTNPGLPLSLAGDRTRQKYTRISVMTCQHNVRVYCASRGDVTTNTDILVVLTFVQVSALVAVVF